MKLYTKETLIEAIRAIAAQGWHKSVKTTVDTRNDGAVGNTLETLLGIEENNVPLPNAQEWELKGQRKDSQSLVTLKHIEPSPQAVKIVPQLLLPGYGWPHEQAGKKYSDTEKSFRSTTSVASYTNRGFRLLLDRKQNKLRLEFNAKAADKQSPRVASCLKSIEESVGLGPLNLEPYWGLEDLRYTIGAKIKNCFYVTAERKLDKGWELFRYQRFLVLSGFDFEGFLQCLEEGTVYVDFDARTGHNHGTKFRIKQNVWDRLYQNIQTWELHDEESE